ncbi:MAG: signal peptidase I [Planctomycetota bacterium]|jgi:signal peptidase I
MEVHEDNYPNRRQPWVAVFLSLVMPGLGQIYCGDIRSGIVIMLVIAVLSSAWVVGMMHESTPALPFLLMMWGIISLATAFAAIDACRRARRTRYDYQLKDYNHWGIYLSLIWIAGAGTIGYTVYVKTNLLEAFAIPANSMAPTIMAGDRCTASKIAYRKTDPKRGDVVLFKNPANRTMNYIKRIVAIEGEKLEIRNGELLINDRALKREWIQKKTLATEKEKIEGDIFWETNGDARYRILISKGKEDATGGQQDFGPVTVPPHHCFVMGDNRNHSIDSRNFGTISFGAINGKFQAIYWPYRNWALLDAQQ